VNESGADDEPKKKILWKTKNVSCSCRFSMPNETPNTGRTGFERDSPWNDGKDGTMLRSSRLLLVSKLNGKILYVRRKMNITVRPATDFADVKEVVGPKHPEASVCWCLTYRLPAKENKALTGPARGERVAAMLKEGPIGVLAYEDDEPVGWAAVAPRSATTFDRSRTIPRVDGA